MLKRSNDSKKKKKKTLWGAKIKQRTQSNQTCLLLVELRWVQCGLRSPRRLQHRRHQLHSGHHLRRMARRQAHRRDRQRPSRRRNGHLRTSHHLHHCSQRLPWNPWIPSPRWRLVLLRLNLPGFNAQQIASHFAPRLQGSGSTWRTRHRSVKARSSLQATLELPSTTLTMIRSSSLLLLWDRVRTVLNSKYVCLQLINYYVREKYTLRYTGGMVPDVNQVMWCTPKPQEGLKILPRHMIKHLVCMCRSSWRRRASSPTWRLRVPRPSWGCCSRWRLSGSSSRKQEGTAATAPGRCWTRWSRTWTTELKWLMGPRTRSSDSKRLFMALRGSTRQVRLLELLPNSLSSTALPSPNLHKSSHKSDSWVEKNKRWQTSYQFYSFSCHLLLVWNIFFWAMKEKRKNASIMAINCL